MRTLSFTVALMCAAAAPALAATESNTCTRGPDARVIEVLSPGKVGKACDLNVIRDNGSYVSTPYHADNSADFCATRAKAILSSLAAEGFSCGPTPAAIAAAAPAPTPEVAETSIEDASPTPDAMESLIAKSTAPTAETEAPATDSLASNPQPAPVAAVEAPAPALAAEAATPVATTVDRAPQAVADAPTAAPSDSSHVIEQPPLAAAPEAEAPAQVASAGPVALSPTNASALKGMRAPRPAAGRFVGAEADARPLDAIDEEVAEERLGETAPTPAAPVSSTAPAPAKIAGSAAPATTPMAATAPKARAAEDIIKGLLAAQQAAWNDGDLEAFMGVYWKDPELRFISGGTVSKGWKETMHHFRSTYGEGAAMGRLTLDNLDVDLVDDDVATVVGRYRVARGGATEVGLFTLVMKRFDGLWRIVHDHATPEAPRTN